MNLTLEEFLVELNELRSEHNLILELLDSKVQIDYALQLKNRRLIIENIIDPLGYTWSEDIRKSKSPGSDYYLHVTLGVYDMDYWLTAVDYRCLNRPLEDLGYQEVAVILDLVNRDDKIDMAQVELRAQARIWEYYLISKKLGPKFRITKDFNLQ